MAVTLKVYDEDLQTSIGTITGAYNIGWMRELLGVGVGSFTVPHDDTVVAANSDILDPGNLVVVSDGGTDRFAFVIRSRNRTKGDTFDPVDVSGPDAVELLQQALVYPSGGLGGLLADTRLFAWQGLDYETSGWTTPTSLGTYADPTDDSLTSSIVTLVDEVQTVELNADTSGFPWGDGSTYPSPGGLPGTWTMTHRGNTTSAIQYDASTGDIETALEALPHIDGVTVGGTGPTSSFTVTFDGTDVAGKQQPLLSVDHSQLRHQSPAQGAYVVRTTAGTKQVTATDILEGWPDPRAVWMGDYGTDVAYRRVLRVDDDGRDGPARIYVSSLDEFAVWFDGEQLGDGGTLDLLTFDVELSPTDHVIAVSASAPTIVTIVSVDADGNPDTVVYRSLASGAVAPGWEAFEGDPDGVTPGYLVKTLFDEANARGFLPAITIDFDATNDSNSDAWTVDLETGVQVGNDSVLSVAERLRDLDVHFEMAPDLTFSMWEGVRADRGATPDSATVTVNVDEVFDVYTRTEDELFTALLLRTSDSWVERHIAGIRREGFVSLGTVPSVSGANTIADALLSDLQVARETFGWSFYSDQAGVPATFTDFEVGDVIVGPLLTSMAGSWSTGDVRVDTVAAEVVDNGEVKYSFEVSAP